MARLHKNDSNNNSCISLNVLCQNCLQILLLLNGNTAIGPLHATHLSQVLQVRLHRCGQLDLHYRQTGLGSHLVGRRFVPVWVADLSSVAFCFRCHVTVRVTYFAQAVKWGIRMPCSEEEKSRLFYSANKKKTNKKKHTQNATLKCHLVCRWLPVCVAK